MEQDQGWAKYSGVTDGSDERGGDPCSAAHGDEVSMQLMRAEAAVHSQSGEQCVSEGPRLLSNAPHPVRHGKSVHLER
jgi:hypothetical protein